MIRISTTDIRVGDHVRTYDAEGIVINYHRGPRPSMTLRLPFDGVTTTYCHMTEAGSVELLSELGNRVACKSFGRW